MKRLLAPPFAPLLVSLLLASLAACSTPSSTVPPVAPRAANPLTPPPVSYPAPPPVRLVAPSAVSHPAPPAMSPVEPHCADPDRLLPAETARALDRRLADFARATGRPVFLHLAATTPPDPTGRKINLVVQDLAAALGVTQDGVLLFYAADRNEWKLWLGDALLPAVMGRPGTAADFTPDGSLHAKKESLLAAAAQLTAAPATSATSASAPPVTRSDGSPAVSPVAPTPARLAQACDAALDAIFHALTADPK